jgi:MoxR-like ATPase
MQQGNTLEALPTSVDAQRDAVALARKALGRIILGKDEQIGLALSCLLARGHLLIEDLPGLGKTMLAQSLARTLGLSFRRIQFTSDLLPADIIGVSVFRQESGEFEFQPGPVFSQLILADEVNRATPKAQSGINTDTPKTPQERPFRIISRNIRVADAATLPSAWRP